MEPSNPNTSRFSAFFSLSRINWRAWLPSRGNVVFTLVVLVTLFWAQSANALPWNKPNAAGTSTGTWPYQGRLANSAGEPITNTVPMIFRLYSAATGETPLWEEQWTGPNSVQVSDGLFNVMLGSLTPIPQDLVTGNGSLWLGITAGTDDEMTPRIQLGSVPFAVQALTVPDGSIGTVKLADASVTTAKIADAGITTAKLTDGSVTQAKLGANVSFVPPDGSVTEAKIANGAVTQQKAPTLISAANSDNAQFYFGSESLTVSGTQTILSKTIVISPSCSRNLRVIITPRFNSYADVLGTSGSPWGNDRFTVFLYRNGATWTNGQLQTFDWLAICQ